MRSFHALPQFSYVTQGKINTFTAQEDIREETQELFFLAPIVLMFLAVGWAVYLLKIAIVKIANDSWEMTGYIIGGVRKISEICKNTINDEILIICDGCRIWYIERTH